MLRDNSEPELLATMLTMSYYKAQFFLISLL